MMERGLDNKENILHTEKGVSKPKAKDSEKAKATKMLSYWKKKNTIPKDRMNKIFDLIKNPEYHYADIQAQVEEMMQNPELKPRHKIDLINARISLAKLMHGEVHKNINLNIEVDYTRKLMEFKQNLEKTKTIDVESE